MTQKQIFPWGRSLEEYRRMFSLSAQELELKIVGCADGPASFNFEMKELGHRIVSCDPLYEHTGTRIEENIQAQYEDRIRDAMEHKDKFVWDRIKSPEEMGRLRMASMKKFLADYEQGKAEGRYLTESLPTLSFEEQEFDLALCSHFLFLYTHALTCEFHLASIKELARVAKEARIFPILDFDGNQSKYVKEVKQELSKEGYLISIEKVDYEFQKGGNMMMRVGLA